MSNFEDIFNKSEVKTTITSLCDDFLNSNPEYKKYNIEIAIQFAVTNYASVRAMVFYSPDTSPSDNNPLTALLINNYNIISNIKKIINDNNLSVPMYQRLVYYSAESA